jgi:tetratricopeptide (TPR) repeat protein
MAATALWAILLAQSAPDARIAELDRLIEAGNRASEGRKYPEQKAAFAAALPIAREVHVDLARVLNGLASAERHLGDIEDSLSHFKQAIKAWEGDPLRDRGLPASLTNYGLLLCETGRCTEALDKHREAYSLSKDERQRPIVLNNMAIAYSQLGDFAAAARDYEGAAILLTNMRQAALAARAWLNHASALLKLGDRDRARESLAKAAEIKLSPELTADHASYSARVAAADGDWSGAAALAAKAANAYRELNDPRGESSARHELGVALHRLGKSGEALRELSSALEIRGPRFYAAAADTRASIALVHFDRGELKLAQEAVESSIDGIEDVRSGVASEQFRAAYLSSKQDYFELWIEILMRRHESEPGAGFDKRAFGAAERARARSLLDLATASRDQIRNGLNPELLATERRAYRRLNYVSRDTKASVKQLDDAWRDYREADMKLREVHPSFAALTRPKISEADEVARQLDKDTQLVEFALGERRSVAWLIGPDRIEAYFLPGRAEIESLLGKGRMPSPGLADALFGQFADKLTARRLALVPDGPLARVPFGALTLRGRSMLSRFEIVELPSASFLGVLRAPRRTTPASGIAIVADPIYEPNESRVLQAAAGSHSGFSRLAFSAREAARIKEAVRGPAVSLEGEKARKNSFFDGTLRGRETLHLAVHAVVDSERPLESALALSHFDTQGRPLDGLLRLPELYDLRIDATLVVLNGCNTANGRDLRGEGVFGFSRPFFHAGARSLILTLWPVDDEASAALMGEFYDRYYSGKSAASALREAQLAIRGEPRWSAPHYWAGYVLQGDWATRAVVPSANDARRSRAIPRVAK